MELDICLVSDISDFCRALPKESVDMIFCDLPYGMTELWWDKPIPFPKVWKALLHTIKPHGAIVMTGSQPFTSKLLLSQPKLFRYEWIWDKAITTGWLDKDNRPMKRHENILVFSKQATAYYPQMSRGNRIRSFTRTGGTSVYGNNRQDRTTDYTDERFPTSILYFPNQPTRMLRATEKPIDLLDYLIRTYSQPGETVLDPCCGRGATAVAARQAGRHYLCADLDSEAVQMTHERLAMPYTLPMFDTPELAQTAAQTEMFPEQVQI